MNLSRLLTYCSSSVHLQLVLVAVAYAACSKPANTCTCKDRDLDESFRSSPVVVVAKIGAQVHSSASQYLLYNVTIEGVWKGDASFERVLKEDLSSKIMLVSTVAAAACGRKLVLGDRWIIFAEMPSRRLLTYECDGSHLATPEALTVMTERYGVPKPPG